MEAVLLGDNSIVGYALTDSGLILFGALLVLFGLTIGLVFLLHQFSNYVYQALIADLVLILLLLIGIIMLDLTGASGGQSTFGVIKDLSEVFSTHRWLLIQLPVLLTMSSIIVLFTHKEKIKDKQSKTYRWATQISVMVSFASVLLIAFESLI